MTEQVYEFWPGKAVVLDTCRGTFQASMACWKIPKNRRVVGFEKNFSCFHDAFFWLVKIYTKQILNPGQHKAGRGGAVETSVVVVKKTKALSLKRRANSRDVLAGSSCLQIVPVYMV